MAKRRVTTKKVLGKLDISEELFDSFLCSVGIDTAYEREAKKYSSTRYSYITDRGYGWYSAEECWALSNAQIARHIGYYELNSSLDRIPEFYGIRAPKRFPVTWVDFDIDNANHNFTDERLFKILQTFDDEPCLVQYREESGNFSVLMQCIPLYPEKHRAIFTEILECVGLEVKDGVVEIYPSVERARRLPFGDQIIFNGGGYRKRPTDDPIPWADQKLWKFEVLKEHWCINPYQVLRGIKGHRTYFVSVDGCQKQEAENSEKKTLKPRGSKKEARVHLSVNDSDSDSPQIKTILKVGLTEASTRYFTETRLIRWCYTKGKSAEEAYELIADWYESGKTNGFSKDWFGGAKRVLTALKRHIATFYRWLRKRWSGPKVVDTEALTTEDVHQIIAVCDWDLHAAEWLYDCLKWTKARRRYQGHLYLSSKIIRKFRRGRDAIKKYIPLLVEKGILTCVRRDYNVSERCRIWRVDWTFGQRGKIVPEDLSFREVLTLVTTVQEIKAHYPKVTAWRLNGLRKKVAGLVLEEANGKGAPESGFEVALEEYADGIRIEPSPRRKVNNIDGVQLVFEWYPRRE